MFLALSVPASMVWTNTIAAPIQGQEVTQEVADSVNEIVEKDENLEVIGVVGERSLTYFRIEMEKAELNFYDVFNSLADDSKFRVQCRRQKRGGSNISTKVCHPQYVLDRMAQETQDALERGSPFPSFEDIEFSMAKEREESLAYVEKVVTENPQLLEKLMVLNERQAKYEAAKVSN